MSDIYERKVYGKSGKITLSEGEKIMTKRDTG